jgi:hypothetical protein
MRGDINMNIKRLIEHLTLAVLLLTISFALVLPESAIIIKKDIPSAPASLFAWSNQISAIESSGSQDTFEFGESSSATDGIDLPPIDIEHAPFPPPYLAIYSPIDNKKLARDTRLGPASLKTWDVDVEWLSSSSNPTIITLSWEINGFNGCEYTSIILSKYDPFEDEWDFASNMLLEEEYTYSPIWFSGQWLTTHFRISAIVDSTLPEISDVTVTISDPIDIVIGWEKFSCIVSDNIGMDDVKLVLTDTTYGSTEYPMTKNGDEYSCNITIPTADVYSYQIWAKDLSGNENTTAPQPFEVPMNEDINMDGWCHFMDVIAIALNYNTVGPNGWVREDVDNNGEVHFTDVIELSIHYSQSWN